ncbi:glycine cleavage system aminomethyltransferase GcvT [Rhizobium sp.]
MDDQPLLKTPLHALHLSLGARMVPFAGYDMPVQYPLGVMKEHLATRSDCGLFDVSHMGQVTIRPRSGRMEDAALALESLIPVDIVGLKPGRQRYGFFTNDDGGILDDLMVANRGDHYFMVVNAACKEADFCYMAERLSDRCTFEILLDRALVALQGPHAEQVLAEFCPEITSMKFMDVELDDLHDVECIIARSGYSGEDGFEISIPQDKADLVVRRLLDHPDCQPIGLGARDSLRLEAGLCLYGNDIDTTTSPVEAGLEWAIQKVRRKGGARAGGFPGAGRILDELEHGAVRRRVGIRPEGKAPVRSHAPLYADESGQVRIGEVTSGGFGPTVDGPVAMGYVSMAHVKPGTKIFAEVRGKLLPAVVAELPFIVPTYKR